MGSGRVLARVTEPEIDGDERPLVGDGGSEHIGIGPADELFVGHGVDVMSQLDERAGRGDGDVLVELEPHVLGVSGRISCFASHEP